MAKRLVSLDAFRGFTIAAMLLVNNPGDLSDVYGPLLHADMVALFPELRATRVTHSWCGFVAYTFDELMHTGVHDGIHYAMGYCGAGVGTASYFGMRIGQRVLGLPEGVTALDDLPFETRPFYNGKPWCLAASVRWYRWRDRLG
jgi:glycine/D-amino acid oxidase-like deaminating enzyme